MVSIPVYPPAGGEDGLFRCSSAVERLPVKEWVVGSNPTTGANH